MSIAPGRKRLFSSHRLCERCGRGTRQICHSIHYLQEEGSDAYRKVLSWICDECVNANEEVREVREPSERLMVLRRLLNLSEDYDLDHAGIEVRGNGIVFTADLPDVDMTRLRRIAERYREDDDFMRLSDLMEIQEAGYRRPDQIPIKRISPNRLRKRQREAAFR